MTLTIVVVGIFLLVGLAIVVGLSMDTDVRRRRNQETARERRERAEEFRRLQDQRWSSPADLSPTERERTSEATGKEDPNLPPNGPVQPEDPTRDEP
jgi:type II secretory pathway pseudopilin PulG